MAVATITKQAFLAHAEKTNAALADVKATLDKHEHVLFGNGDIGMDEQIRNIWTLLKKQEAEKAKEEDNRNYYQRMLIGLLITNLTAVMSAAAIWFIKIAPVVNELATKTP